MQYPAEQSPSVLLQKKRWKAKEQTKVHMYACGLLSFDECVLHCMLVEGVIISFFMD